jgi:5,10-methenyltetrahydromethanopterin hydrogenase
MQNEVTVINPITIDLEIYNRLKNGESITSIKKYAKQEGIPEIEQHISNAKNILNLQHKVTELQLFKDQLETLDLLFEMNFKAMNLKECRSILNEKRVIYITYVNYISVHLKVNDERENPKVRRVKKVARHVPKRPRKKPAEGNKDHKGGGTGSPDVK